MVEVISETIVRTYSDESGHDFVGHSGHILGPRCQPPHSGIIRSIDTKLLLYCRVGHDRQHQYVVCSETLYHHHIKDMKN